MPVYRESLHCTSLEMLALRSMLVMEHMRRIVLLSEVWGAQIHSHYRYIRGYLSPVLAIVSLQVLVA
jgi:hypothetical protein